MKTALRRTEPYKMLQRTTKPLKRRVLIEEDLAKSPKNQHSEKTQTSGIFVNRWFFIPWIPLKELHSTCETIVWRDSGGSWACLPPVYKCNHPATVCDTCGICPKEYTKNRGALGNTKKTKITRRAGTWVEEVLSLFTIVCEITLPQAMTYRLPLKSTLRREKH